MCACVLEGFVCVCVMGHMCVYLCLSVHACVGGCVCLRVLEGWVCMCLCILAGCVCVCACVDRLIYRMMDIDTYKHAQTYIHVRVCVCVIP